ncbi:MAG: hypothetical protein ACOYK9_01870 [Chlamydiia bacterium]
MFSIGSTVAYLYGKAFRTPLKPALQQPPLQPSQLINLFYEKQEYLYAAFSHLNPDYTFYSLQIEDLRVEKLAQREGFTPFSDISHDPKKTILFLTAPPAIKKTSPDDMDSIEEKKDFDLLKAYAWNQIFLIVERTGDVGSPSLLAYLDTITQEDHCLTKLEGPIDTAHPDTKYGIKYSATIEMNNNLICQCLVLEKDFRGQQEEEIAL